MMKMEEQQLTWRQFAQALGIATADFDDRQIKEVIKLYFELHPEMTVDQILEWIRSPEKDPQWRP